MGQILPTASLHRDHSISYALVCEIEFSYMSCQPIVHGQRWEKNIFPRKISDIFFQCARVTRSLYEATLFKI